MIFDTHAHYDDEAFDDDREKLIRENAKQRCRICRKRRRKYVIM